MPMRLATIFRILFVLVLATWVFLMYCLARTMDESIGFSPGRTLLGFAFAFGMLVPLVWLVTIPEIPEIVIKGRGRRWWRDGRCPECGYVRPERPTDDETCSECGGALAEPAHYAVGRRTIVRYVVINLLAWIFGCLAGEAWLQADERAFFEEAAAAPADRPYSRARVWPVSERWMTTETPETD